MATVLRWFAAGARLVTLTGPGGSGKTRLAQAIGSELLDQFPDGVFFVDLAPVRDPAYVVSTIAHVVGIREAAGQPLAQSLAHALADRQLLLILDNFEQVVAAAPDIAALLAAAPALRLLATSRELLRIRAEQTLPAPRCPCRIRITWLRSPRSVMYRLSPCSSHGRRRPIQRSP
jgi:predicted ATPase